MALTPRPAFRETIPIHVPYELAEQVRALFQAQLEAYQVTLGLLTPEDRDNIAPTSQRRKEFFRSAIAALGGVVLDP